MGTSRHRLLAAVGLLLVPIALLGWFFVAQTRKDTNLATNELLGVQYLRALVPILAQLASDDAPISESDVSAFIENTAALNIKLGASVESAALISALRQVPLDRSTAISATLRLTAEVGDNSGLVLDPDLPTYYLMDATLSRIPGLLAATSRLTYLADPNSSSELAPHRLARLLVTFGELRAAIHGLENSLTVALGADPTGALRLELEPQAQEYSASMRTLLNEIELQSTPGSWSVPAVQRIRDHHEMMVTETAAIWLASTAQLERLIKERISGIFSRLWLALAFSLIVAIGAVVLALSVLRQLVERLDEKIIFLAHHDPMTELKNRASFGAELTDAVASVGSTGQLIAVHVVDLDTFKSINDTLGHAAGDEVLVEAAKRLVSSVGRQGIVARFGGDEFVILQRHVVSPTDVSAVADRIVRSMRRSFDVSGQLVAGSVSVGSAMYGVHASDGEELLRCADMALYDAKQAGRDRYCVYSKDLQTRRERQAYLEREVRHALENDKFSLAFQPQYDVAGVKLIGFEALIRLVDRAGIAISPSEFIPVGERLSLINRIGEWVVREACSTASSWPDDILIAVNLSPLQFSSGQVAHVIQSALASSGLPANKLQIEITEGIVLDDSPIVATELAAIRKLGVSIAMDDFGTGYSSLSHLWRLPIDKLKIDRSFVSALRSDSARAESMLRTIVTLGHSMGMTVIAEGVETSDQVSVLEQIKCDQIQGFVYGKPIQAAEIGALILSTRLNDHPTPLLVSPTCACA